MNIGSGIFVPLALGLVIAGIVYATLNGKQLPLISSPRGALIAILVIGFAMCMPGIGQVGASGRWASPLAILGILLGAAILVIILATFTGWKLPLISNEIQAVAAVAILIAVKWMIGTASFFFHWL